MEEFLNDFRQYVIKNSNLKYNDLTYVIFKRYREYFLDPNFVITINEDVSNLFLIFSPFMHVFDVEHIKHRQMLFALNDGILVEDEDKLNCIGSGYIGTNSVVIVGMAPGFYNGNETDKLSKPFKPSFYFALTSKMLREGFKSKLKRIYFTNLSKLCLSRNLMDDKSYNNLYSYENMYEKYLHILTEEINILKPKKIIALGRDVHNFMRDNNIESEYAYHPSYFCYRKQFNDGKKYYKGLLGE